MESAVLICKRLQVGCRSAEKVKDGMSHIKVIAKNRRAFFEYEISERIEAGIVLRGTEVKSLRAGKVNLSDGWVDFSTDGQVFLKQVHIGIWEFGNSLNHQETRSRELLLRKKEIIRLSHSVSVRSFSIVPLKVYLKGQFIKVELGLGKGKKAHDKRAATQKREADRAIERALKR